MRKKILRTIILILSLVVCTMFFASCKKDPIDNTVARPIKAPIDLKRDADELIYRWQGVPNAQSYQFTVNDGSSNIIDTNIPKNSDDKINDYSYEFDFELVKKPNTYIISVISVSDPNDKTIENSSPATAKLIITEGFSKEFPFEIKTYDDLLRVSEIPKGYFKLMNDIDLTDIDFKPLCNNEGDITKFGGFSGEFDGNGYAINNLNVLTGTNLYSGLFHRLYDAKIFNLTLNNVTNYSPRVAEYKAQTVGGLAGTSEKSEITNVKINGLNINWELHHNRNNQTLIIGGLFGETYNDNTITNCQVRGTIDGASIFNTAGVGEDENVNIAKFNSNIYVGGLIGYNMLDNKSTKNSTIDRSYFDGSISTNGNTISVGGIIGKSINKGAWIPNRIKITNSYTRGNITVNEEYYNTIFKKRIGSIIGESDYIIVDRVYSATKFDISKDIPFDTNLPTRQPMNDYEVFRNSIGFIGYNIATNQSHNSSWSHGPYPASREISNCYYDSSLINSSLVPNFAGIGEWPTNHRDVNTWIKAKSTLEMKTRATFIDWNFTDIWSISEDNYPILK